MFERILLSDTSAQVGEPRVSLDQPVPEKVVLAFRFSEDIDRRIRDLELANELLTRRIEVLERRTLWDYVRSAWRGIKLKLFSP